MSYPGYSGQGYGGAGPSYPPYPNSHPLHPPPQHATTTLSYPAVGFQPPQSPYPSHFAMPQPGGYPPQMPYPPGPQAPAPASYPPYQSQPHTASPYPPSGSPYGSASPPYPLASSQHAPAPSPYPPASSPYPPASSPCPPTSSPYPPASSSYPPASSPYPSSGPHASMHGSPYPPSTQPAKLYPSVPSATLYPGAPSSHNLTVRKGNPTVHPVQPFDPRSDAEILRTAMKGFGTDEKAIINVLARRSNTQRQEIALQFKTLYGKDLISNLKSELGGKFEDLILAMMKPHYEFMAKEVHDALAGIGTDEETVIEVICSATNGEIHAIKSTYQHMYGRTLEEDLKGDTSGHFKRLMISLCMGNRSEDYNVDPAAAQADAQALLRAGELRAGTDESTFNAVICQRSYPQLQAVMQEYQRITGHSLQKAVKHEFSGDIEEGLLTILRCVENRPAYFAERLYKSLKGMGTDDRSLIRLVVSRCEVDMADIKAAFQDAYGKTLESFITGDTSGDYKKCLLALIGEY